MAPSDGYRLIKLQALALLFFLFLPERMAAQQGILDSAFIFREGTVKTGSALDAISRKTGYNFTYDSRLVDTEKKTELNFSGMSLRDVLKRVVGSDSLQFSVIDKYIIISRAYSAPSPAPDQAALLAADYITGLVIDNETFEPLPFATLGLKRSGRGTVTNGNGEFGLKITPEIFDDTILITYLGYIRREVPVKQSLGNDFTISMEKEFISIPEIIIKNQVPQEIISRARKAIPANYGNTPSLLTGFYREGVMKKSELQTYSEAVIYIYKSSYSATILGDQIKVFKSRKVENTDRSDTLAIRLKAGLNTCLELDGAKNIFDFLTVENSQDYSYRLSDIVTYDEESAYAIDFEQHEGIDQPLYKGTIYINTTDYAILHVDFELNQKYIYKMKESFIANSSHGFITWPVTVNYSVSYRQMDGRYFLSHVRGDLLFTSNKKRKLFKSLFKVFFELAVTDTQTEGVTRFDRDELAPVHSIFSKTIKNYDQLFWGNQDFLRPEDNLLQALKNMNVKMQEFSEDK